MVSQESLTVPITNAPWIVSEESLIVSVSTSSTIGKERVAAQINTTVPLGVELTFLHCLELNCIRRL